MSDEKDPTQDDNQENLSTEQDEGGGEQEDAPRFSPVVSRGAVADREWSYPDSSSSLSTTVPCPA